MSIILVLPILLPLGAGALAAAVGGNRRAQQVVTVSALVAALASGVAILRHVSMEGIAVVHVGGWLPPTGISLVADTFAALLLVVSSTVVLFVLLYAIGQQSRVGRAPEARREARREARVFHPAYLILAAGVSASFLSGDLFTLFVAFEVMLGASYVLITLGGRPGQIRHGMTYVVINLLASTIFLTTVGLLYAATGTVHLADLAQRIDAVPAGLRSALGMMLLVGFGIKAAIFPLFSWLPDSYPTAPTPITAVFAGLLTKVGVYAIIRTQTLLFADLGTPSPLLLWIAGLTMVVGVLGAMAQDDIKRILSFHIVSQIGYMLMGLGLLTVAGLAGATFYMVHHILVKGSLFLVGGLVEQRTGSSALHRLGGMVRSAPVVAVLFGVAAMGLAGLPPTSGFVAKLSLATAGLEAGQSLIVGVSLAVSLLTLFSMTKIWTGAFWGDPEPVAERETALVIAGGSGDAAPGGLGGSGQRATAGDQDGAGNSGGDRLMVLATTAMIVVSLGVAAGAGSLWELSLGAAELLNPASYTEAVLGR